MLSSRKKKFERFFDALVWPLKKLGLTPNQVTVLTPIFAIIFAYFLAKGAYTAALVILAGSVLFDALDGHLARQTKSATKYGAYLDTILDRYVESIIYLSFLLIPLPEIFAPAQFWVALCIIGALMTTYAKAAYTEKTGNSFSGGFLERAERMLLIILGVALLPINPTYLVYILITLAVLTNLSAIDRIRKALKLCTKN